MAVFSNEVWTNLCLGVQIPNFQNYSWKDFGRACRRWATSPHQLGIHLTHLLHSCTSTTGHQIGLHTRKPTFVVFEKNLCYQRQQRVQRVSFSCTFLTFDCWMSASFSLKPLKTWLGFQYSILGCQMCSNPLHCWTTLQSSKLPVLYAPNNHTHFYLSALHLELNLSCWWREMVS